MELEWVHPEKANVLVLSSGILCFLKRKLAFQSVHVSVQLSFWKPPPRLSRILTAFVH